MDTELWQVAVGSVQQLWLSLADVDDECPLPTRAPQLLGHDSMGSPWKAMNAVYSSIQRGCVGCLFVAQQQSMPTDDDRLSPIAKMSKDTSDVPPMSSYGGIPFENNALQLSSTIMVALHINSNGPQDQTDKCK